MEAKSAMRVSEEAERSLAAEAEAYRNDGYVFLERLFPPQVLSVFHARLQSDLDLMNSRKFVKKGFLTEKSSIEVYSVDYPPMAAFLSGLTPRVEQIAGCELMPSYAYFRVYQQGDVCKVHSDRPACEHSLSLMLELADDKPWALSVEHRHMADPVPTLDEDFGDEAFTALPMRAGDAVMYRGVNHRHGRIEPNPNLWSAHLFMHWVDVDGPHADHAFDRVNIEALQSGAA
ncbi:MAG TPA: hypothetical protein VF027_02690 [Sphingomicrobium sp.]